MCVCVCFDEKHLLVYNYYSQYTIITIITAAITTIKIPHREYYYILYLEVGSLIDGFVNSFKVI